MSLLNRTRQPVLGYHAACDFLLKNGKEMTKLCQSVPIKRGPMGRCFENARKLVLRYPNQFIYCEGYAVGCIIPMEHAWVIMRDGHIFDPTWGNGSDYFGVAIRTCYLRRRFKIQRKEGVYNFINVHQFRWPMLSARPSAWRHPIMDRL